jgi:acyl-coenzyme A thioesterase PaaI-like protein
MIRHHDVCFGCGQANLFGLQLEIEQRPEGGVGGRFFVKQDHQGPPGFAHGGVIAAALDEAMSLALHGQGTYALTRRLEIHLHAPAAVGSFVGLEADVERVEGREVQVEARALGEDGGVLAAARGTFIESSAGDPG